MAKKKKKYLIKLNNKIRNYFNGQPFDEGITTLDEDKLIELVMLLELELLSHEREDMVRALRRVWSEEGASTREMIVSYLTKGHKATHSGQREKHNDDKVGKIISILSNIEHTTQEENIILEAFIDAKHFNKLLLCQTESLELDIMSSFDDETMLEKLASIKEESIAKKQEELDAFLELVNKEEHPYLTAEEIHKALKSMPPEAALYHAPLGLDIVEKILTNISDKYDVFESTDHVIIEKEKNHDLFGTQLYYNTSVSYEKPFLYNLIWKGSELPVKEDINGVNDDLLAHFKVAVTDILEEMKEESEKLDISDETLHEFIVRFVEPQIRSSRTLKFKEKSKRRILFHFGEYIKPLLAKQKREELLAKTIRDFKNLFPLARQLKRKIAFHVGPTNSGKTYAALKELESATTGYYLAPLRLLALEGYENLQKNGVHVSLITGEEEIIDEESTHISSTIEMMNGSVDVDVCVIDEIQMLSDRDRVPAVQELCEYLDEELEIIHFERKNELNMMQTPVNMKYIEPQTAIVAFSRRDVLSLKQQLSERYSVSVVYGNLSPEVRREEARRFREGESQILVSTDAIAMGLNLPIKTLLFAKDNKFDGIRRRELLPTEVSQIAGRAGRYGFEEKGYVGAMEENTLSTISSLFHAPLPDIELPVSVMASLEHVMLIGEILETEDVTTILGFFADNMEFEGPFIAANIDSMLEIATIVDEYHLDLKTRYFLSCAPASVSSPYIESVFHRYIKQIEAGGQVLYIPPRDLPSFAQTNDMLLNAEDRVREISLYLWLSFKFPDIFQDVQKALQARLRLNSYIENSLRQGHFTKQCRKCGKVLDFSYRFSICDECHSRNKRGYGNNANRGGYRGRRRR